MLNHQINRNNKSISFTLSSPIKGLNVRDNPLNMDSDYAIAMDNYIPLNNKVVLRKGYVRYLSTAGKVETVTSYKSGANLKLLAIWGVKLHDITSAGNPQEYETPIFSVNRCYTKQYKNYLYFVNGMDVPKVYYIDNQNAEHLEKRVMEIHNGDCKAAVDEMMAKSDAEIRALYNSREIEK